jgi:hypothetical protein
MALTRRMQYVLGLLLINIIIWLPLFFSQGVILNRDFHFPIFSENFLEYHVTTWNSYASQSNIEQLPRLFLRSPFLLLAYAGVSIDIVIKLLILFTCAFVSIMSFLFLSEMLKHAGLQKGEFAAAVCAFFIAYNPASMQFLGGISILFGVGVLAMMLYCVLRLTEGFRPIWIVIAALGIPLSAGHPFMLLMNAGIFSAFALLLLSRREAVRSVLLTGVAGTLLCSFFLFPYIATGLTKSTELGRSDNLSEGVINTISDNELYKVVLAERDQFLYVDADSEGALGIVHYFSLSLMVMLAISGFWLLHNHSARIAKLYLFACLLLIASLLLSFGTKGLLGDIYIQMINKLPLGWTFRSPLKFQLFQTFFIGVMAAISLGTYMQTHAKRQKQIITGAVVLMLAMTAPGFVSAAFDTFQPFSLPDEYYTISNMLHDQGTSTKVLWYPRYDERGTDWAPDKKIAAFDSRSSRMPTYSTYLNRDFVIETVYFNPYRSNAFREPAFYSNLSKLNVQYIAFHYDRGEEYDRSRLVAIGNHTTTVFSGNNWTLFKLNEEAAGHIQIGGTAVPYQKESSTKYVVNYTGPAQSITLRLAETFDNGWQAAVIDGDKIVDKQRPLRALNMINEFTLRVPENARIVITYTPQRWYVYGLYTSILILLILIVWSIIAERIHAKQTQ